MKDTSDCSNSCGLKECALERIASRYSRILVCLVETTMGYRDHSPGCRFQSLRGHKSVKIHDKGMKKTQILTNYIVDTYSSPLIGSYTRAEILSLGNVANTETDCVASVVFIATISCRYPCPAGFSYIQLFWNVPFATKSVPVF